MFINDVPLLSESLWSCLQLASLIFYELEEMFINDVPLLSESLWSCLQLASLIFYELGQHFLFFWFTRSADS